MPLKKGVGGCPVVDDIQLLRRGLATVRRRRLLLWAVLIIYLPAMWTAQEATGSFEGALPFFFGWVVLLLIVTGISATAKCPRCRNFFHVNGMTMLFLRKCLHCQLHLMADRSSKDNPILTPTLPLKGRGELRTPDPPLEGEGGTEDTRSSP